MQLNPTIFREYDIRGTVGKDLSEEFAYVLGRAYATLAIEHGKNEIAIGYDCRLSSEGYAKALARGISDEGLNVWITGMGPTPQLYFALYSRNVGKSFGGGIQVTGSHNPPEMNGFKVCLGTDSLSGEAIQDLYLRAQKVLTTPPRAPGTGTIKEHPIREIYIKELIENVRPHLGKRKLKVVVDAGNGVGGLVGPAVLRGLGAEVIELFCEPDGRFPNHHPDPAVVKNLESLIKKVRETKADFGIGWDGDADRIGVVDDQGQVIFGDMLVLIYAREVLAEAPGSLIIGDVKCSSLLFSEVQRLGGKPLMWKTGHSLIKQKLKELNGALAGEMSGHICFKQRYYGFDDALYCSARFLEIVSKSDRPVSQLLADLPTMVSTPEIRIDCAEEVKFKIPQMAKEAFKEFEVIDIDGVRINFEHGWALIRASNTQPVLVMRFEADTDAHLKEYQSLVNERVHAIEQSVQR